MENIAIYLAFFLGGAFFGGWLPAARFMILAVIVTIVYFFSLALSLPPVGAAIGKSLSAFLCIQIGYVVGLGLATIARDSLRRSKSQFQVKNLDTSEKTLK